MSLATTGWARKLTLIVVSAGVFFSSVVHAQGNAVTQEQAPEDPRRAFSLLENGNLQQVPLELDRFRIDYAIDEITLVIFRYPDTAPAVVTLPDGTKWYASRHPRNVAWYSAQDYDLIRVKEPVPGPWQVTGRIRPDSRIMVVSDIEFTPDPLPELLFRGETIGVEGRVTQAGDDIDQRDFRSVIRLEMLLNSTNNPDYDNFGQAIVSLGEFADDGLEMDRVPKDGVFTGKIELDIAAGEYIPTYRVRTPLHTRVFEGEPILIHQQPVRPQVQVAANDNEPHRIEFQVDEQMIDRNDIVLSGRVNYPNGERQNVSIVTAQDDDLQVQVPSYTYGVFQLELSLNGTDKNGREFKMDLPTTEFRSQRPIEAPESEVNEAELAEAAAEQAHQQALNELQAERAETSNRLVWVVVVNLAIVAVWMFIMLMSRGRNPARKAVKAAKAKEKADKKAAKKEAKAKAKNGNSD
ncbi:TIGR03503 family protein [Aliidiomarina celeris]|uniref:TIGR03503 family protein n=1 Tax=Aliidiomarina celeris TaxID=2249428 RepID=UPI000DE7FFBC|nr:TIGR03503 family protein [Aliidiomarina celeris]